MTSQKIWTENEEERETSSLQQWIVLMFEFLIVQLQLIN